MTEMTTHSMLKKEMDLLFKAIDDSPVSEKHPIFMKADDKEYYETQLMFAYRKHEAAEHHIANVETRLVADEATAMAAMRKPKKLAKNVVASTSQMITDVGSHAYVHELAAFLAAIRSGVDFLATAAARTIPGVKAKSVHTLENMVKKGQGGKVLDVIKAHQPWLAQLRGYRDEIVHSHLPQVPAMGWLISTKGMSPNRKTSKAVLPIVVPRITPKRALDTRRSRMANEEVPVGLERRETHGTFVHSDGTEVTLRHNVSFKPSSSHMPIAEFMNHHLSNYRSFSVDMFDAIRRSGFGTLK
ncbi:hypothetical protein G6L35_05905 [Agrobacterium tumefaciens]|uniref:hypothetical protein n=1 Tax=Agrobacterium tumefaciens TaxID=358 RepID=UPI0015721F7B|nr:hypothetical protein [Agrobacterium tumefaciens]NSZ68162.1 hypothetical protein [Agrobacterium tumefaciens]